MCCAAVSGRLAVFPSPPRQCIFPPTPPRPSCAPAHRLIDAEVVPVVKQSSLAGAAEYRTQSPLLREQPHAVDILIDVLSDRGFRWALPALRWQQNWASLCVG